MKKDRLSLKVCAVSILALLCFFAPILFGFSQENPVVNTLYIPLNLGGGPVTTSGIIVIMEQTASGDSATSTEEKKVKPQSEAPIRILPSIRISEKD